ncbi:DNA primase [Streptomyces albofaciens JCM 4342]|uniref:DNA primase n=1 Tax=Streptomyces albofaciens TaxID=66866 RepID=UPI00123A05C7|nr:DNA primase [Streptomyces albofaciens]KAA6222729.1 DNA primase [Streptomyces albofaciens JCM 4342]
MKNRPALVLAVAGGYLLGRTKKAKLAIGIGSMVLGKRLNLGPQQLVSLVNDQIAANPQLKELREQLRGDLKGVGKAATGALVTKRLDSLADSLHERTLNVREQLDAGGAGGKAADTVRGVTGGGRDDEDGSEDAQEEETGGDRGGSRKSAGAQRGAAKKSSSKTGSRSSKTGASGAKSAPDKRKRPAKQAAAAPKKTASAAKKTARSATRRSGGDDRG